MTGELMTKMISWLDDYLIGVDDIDQQHKYLFELINETFKCSEREKLQLSLVKLYRYTREHFNAEESLMKDIHYPEYEQHKKAHNQVITELNVKSKEALDDPTKRDKLDVFLVRWLVVHIIGDDVCIGDFIRKKA